MPKILFALLKGFRNLFVLVNFVLLTASLSVSQVRNNQKSTQKFVKDCVDCVVSLR